MKRTLFTLTLILGIARVHPTNIFGAEPDIIRLAALQKTRHTQPSQPQQTAQFFASLEAWNPASIHKPFEQELGNAVNYFQSNGVSASGSGKATGGGGVRMGLIAPFKKGLETGVSLGYTVGPRITETLDIGPLIYFPTNTVYKSGHAESTTQISYVRLLMDLGANFQLGDGVVFRMGGGAGVAAGYLKQDRMTSGSASVLMNSDSFHDTWTGLTWEVVPSFIIPGSDFDFEVGARFAQFPIRKEDEHISKIDWQPFGAFVSFRFHAPRDTRLARKVYEVPKGSTYDEWAEYLVESRVEARK